MYPRSFIAICLLALLATVTIRAEPAPAPDNADNDKDVEARNPLIALAVTALGKLFKWAAKNCLKEAANNCKSQLKNPKELAKCGGNFLKANKGRCVAGG